MNSEKLTSKEGKTHALSVFKSEGLEINETQITALINSLQNMGILESIKDNINWVYNFFRICFKLNLDPELKEIYAVKFGNSFSVIVDYHQYLKRASLDPNFQGYNAQLIDKDEEGKALDTLKKSILFTCRPKNWDRDYIFEYKMVEGKKPYGEGNNRPEFMLLKTAIKNGLAHCFPHILGVLDQIEQANIAEINAKEIDAKVFNKEIEYDE